MSVTPLTLPQKKNHERNHEESRPAEPPIVYEETHEERIERIMNSDEPLTNEEFELLADEIAEITFRAHGGKPVLLSDYAVSREGIYEDHL